MCCYFQISPEILYFTPSDPCSLSRTQVPAGVASGLAAAKHPDLSPAGWLLWNPMAPALEGCLAKPAGQCFQGGTVNSLKGWTASQHPGTMSVPTGKMLSTQKAHPSLLQSGPATPLPGKISLAMALGWTMIRLFCCGCLMLVVL